MLRTRIGQAEPDRPVRLQPPRERAIVDQRVADAVDAAGRAQRFASHQHAAAGRCGGRARGSFTQANG